MGHGPQHPERGLRDDLPGRLRAARPLGPGVGRADNLIVWFAQVPLPSGASEQVLYYAREDFEAWDFPWQIDEGGRDDLRRGRYVFLDVSAEKRFGPFAVGDYREFQGVRAEGDRADAGGPLLHNHPAGVPGLPDAPGLAPDELRHRTTYIVIKLTPGAVVLLAQPPIVLPSDTSVVIALFGEGPGAITSRTLEKHRRGKCHHIQNTQATHVDPHARAGGLEHRVDRRGRPSDHPAGDDDATPGGRASITWPRNSPGVGTSRGQPRRPVRPGSRKTRAKAVTSYNASAWTCWRSTRPRWTRWAWRRWPCRPARSCQAATVRSSRPKAATIACGGQPWQSRVSTMVTKSDAIFPF